MAARPDTLFLSDPKTEVRLRVNARARRITLRVSAVDGQVTLTLPPRLPLHEAEAFLKRQAEWLRKRLDAAPVLQRPVAGGTVPFLGETFALQTHSKRQAKLAPGTFIIPEGETGGPALGRLLKARARLALIESTEFYAGELGRSFGNISLRDPRGRWGSCSSKGDLMYSWRLIMAPQKVLDYVAAHEVAHLAEMNHSSAFWAVVAQLMPNYEVPRNWLRHHGAALHRHDFT